MASIVVAVCLWIYIALPDKESKQVKFRLDKIDLPDKFVVTEMPSEMFFDVNGTREEIQSLTNIVATVELRNAITGKHDYSVLFPRSISKLVIGAPYTVKVKIENLLSKELPVALDVAGSLSDRDKVLQAPTAIPARVTVTGAESLVNKVSRVEGIVDLNAIAVDDPKDLPVILEAFDSESRPVSRESDRVESFRIFPERVSVRPILLPAPSEKSIVISPTIEGAPAPGFVIESVTAIPNQVSVRGPSAMLAQLRNLRTEKVDISGLTASKRYSVALRLPLSIQAVGAGKSVMVEVKVKALLVTPTSKK